MPSPRALVVSSVWFLRRGRAVAIAVHWWGGWERLQLVLLKCRAHSRLPIPRAWRAVAIGIRHLSQFKVFLFIKFERIPSYLAWNKVRRELGVAGRRLVRRLRPDRQRVRLPDHVLLRRPPRRPPQPGLLPNISVWFDRWWKEGG